MEYDHVKDLPAPIRKSAKKPIKRKRGTLPCGSRQSPSNSPSEEREVQIDDAEEDDAEIDAQIASSAAGRPTAGVASGRASTGGSSK